VLLVAGLVLIGIVLASLDFAPGVTPLNRLTRPWAILSSWETQACAPASAAPCQPYALYVPETYRSNHPAPLVVLLHGYRQSPYSFVRSDIVRLAQEGGYVLIAPRGGGNVWFQGKGEEDALNAIADVRARMAIDPARIYLVGYSMGGYGTLSLGVHHADRFAALVAIASPQREPWAEWVTACPRGPVYLVHGARDRRVPVSDSQALYDHLQALRCDVGLTVLPGVGHTFHALDQVLPELATLFERQGGG
jgi:dipeptidyl aminopeptidase/acylaminoacyl peptidase